MIPAQVAALESFLPTTPLSTTTTMRIGVVIYRFSVGDWTMEVAYGDGATTAYNDVTEDCEEFTKVSSND